MVQKIFLTFDIEDWCHSNFKSRKGNSFGATNIEDEVSRLIDICAEVGVKATCFILGSIAETHPLIVNKLYKAGHEVASHGYNHKLVYDMSPNEFEEDLVKSCHLLEDITGEKVLGFRAPSWSIKADMQDWYYDILGKNGLIYSSSIYPALTYLYGIPGALKTAHIVDTSRNVTIVEIPAPVTNILGKDIGFTGGFYLRLFPTWFIKRNIQKHNGVGFIYLHPREINPFQARMKLSIMEYIIAYYGISSCESKLRKLVKFYRNNITSVMRDYARDEIIINKQL